MKDLIKRLEKLEAAATTDVGWSYPAWRAEQEALVERTAMSKMPPEEVPVLEEIFKTGRSGWSADVSDQRPGVWSHWVEAFTKTDDEIPFARTLIPYDRWC